MSGFVLVHHTQLPSIHTPVSFIQWNPSAMGSWRLKKNYLVIISRDHTTFRILYGGVLCGISLPYLLIYLPTYIHTCTHICKYVHMYIRAYLLHKYLLTYLMTLTPLLCVEGLGVSRIKMHKLRILGHRGRLLARPHGRYTCVHWYIVIFAVGSARLFTYKNV